MLRKVGFLAFCLLFASQAFGAPLSKQKETLENFSAKAEEFKANPAINELLADLTKLTDCLAESRVHIKNEDEKPLERNLKKAQVQIRFIDARLNEIAAREEALAAEDIANKSENAAKKLDQEARTLENKVGN